MIEPLASSSSLQVCLLRLTISIVLHCMYACVCMYMCKLCTCMVCMTRLYVKYGDC